MALREAGFETVMVNCNPETVSTDYDTSDRLYFEPVTEEAVLDVVEAEQGAGAGGVVGVVVALGGQTPLKLAGRLPAELVLGTRPAAIDEAEDRERWAALCARLEIPQPAGGTARTLAEAAEIVSRIGFPALLRPSYVLGGRAMEIVYDDEGLGARPSGPLSLAAEGLLATERPILIDRFLEDAIEVDVDAVRDRAGEVLIGAVMEHVEEAGVHSGDSACVIPPPTLSAETVAVIVGHTCSIAEALVSRGTDQRPVRREAGTGLRHRGEPAGLPDGALRGQGDGRAARQGGGPRAGRCHTRRAEARGSAAAGGRRASRLCSPAT